MQAKMASRSRLLNGAYRRLLQVLMPLFGLLARSLPLGLLYAIGRPIIGAFLLLRPKYERSLRSNLSQILGESEASPAVRSLARRVAQNHGRYSIDFFYWSERGGAAARAAVSGVENLAAMERCLASGRGCVFLTAHLGNWEMGGLLLGDRAREVAVVYVPDRFERVEEYRSRYRRRAGLTEIPVASDAFSALPALRILRSGGVVAVQGDRDFNDSGTAQEFFGRPAFFPRGPAMLALLSGAPILPVFILRMPDAGRAGSGGFRIVFFDPIEPRGDARDEGAVEAIVAETASAIETMVRDHPDQWYCFYPFWDDPTRSGSSRPGGAGERPGHVTSTVAT